MKDIEKNEVQPHKKTNYNDAKIWQIGLFALNDSATNIAMYIMMFYAFFSQNILGLAAVVIGIIAMSMRMFDAIKDPIVGFLLDKTNGRFGKFRPYMLIGNIILFMSIVVMFRIPANLPIGKKYLYTSIVYAIYIIGYTLQCTVTKG